MTNRPDTIPFGDTHTPAETRPLYDGIQHRYRFPNGYGASVVRHYGSYGSDQGLWELAVTVNAEDDRLTYATPITDDVLGRLTEADVASTLNAIAALPEVVAQ